MFIMSSDCAAVFCHPLDVSGVLSGVESQASESLSHRTVNLMRVKKTVPQILNLRLFKPCKVSYMTFYVHVNEYFRFLKPSSWNSSC